MDNQEVTCLVLLDLSATFDTIDHDLLLNRLHLRYGFDETILNWISSYLRSRTQQVLIGGNTFSNLSQLKCGIPQGSVLDQFFSLHSQLLWEKSAENMELTFSQM